MKRYVFKSLAYISIIFIYCIVIFCVIDPYNVYHWKHIRDNGIEPNQNYIKTKYVINNPEKFDSYVLGSSRVGALHVEKLRGQKTYNMTYSQATVDEELETLGVMIKNGVTIKKVYVGLDNATFCNGTDFHSDSGMHLSYSKAQNPLRFMTVFMRPDICFQSLFDDDKNFNEGFETFYQYGWSLDYNHKSSYDWSDVNPQFSEYNDIEYVIDRIKCMKELCDQNGIDVIFFTNPMCEITYKAAIDYNNYYMFLDELSSVTDFYNFSSINDITTSTENYIDSSHYKAEVGDIMLDIMAGDKAEDDLYSQGFGWYVTRDNSDAFIHLLRKQY